MPLAAAFTGPSAIKTRSAHSGILSHMLGVRRTSVSLVAHALQKAGLIRYVRGKIEILDRKGLEECACECYAVVRERIDSRSEAY